MLRLAVATLMLMAFVAVSAAESACYDGCFGNPCDANECRYGYYYREIGPELTGNYSNQYLQSWHTGQNYADPMYYHAQTATKRWKAIRPFSGGTVTPKVYRYKRRIDPTALGAAYTPPNSLQPAP